MYDEASYLGLQMMDYSHYLKLVLTLLYIFKLVYSYPRKCFRRVLYFFNRPIFVFSVE